MQQSWWKHHETVRHITLPFLQSNNNKQWNLFSWPLVQWLVLPLGDNNCWKMIIEKRRKKKKKKKEVEPKKACAPCNEIIIYRAEIIQSLLLNFNSTARWTVKLNQTYQPHIITVQKKAGQWPLALAWTLAWARHDGTITDDANKHLGKDFFLAPNVCIYCEKHLF